MHNQERPRFDPILMTCTELILKLIEGQLVARTPIEPLKPPYPQWYDENAYYDYHFGAQGHSIKSCIALKNKV